MNWFNKWKKSAPTPPVPTQKTTAPIEFDPTQLKPLTANQLFEQLNLKADIRSIKRLAAVSETYWEQLYYQTLINVATVIQLIPASQSHHHSGPGGLLTHTIDVCHIALRRAKSYQLPRDVGPEERRKREQTWRFGVFIGALLHDIGKSLTSVKIELTLTNNGTKLWSPYLGAMPDDTRSYRCLFQQTPYKMHHLISPTLFSLLPGPAQHWLLNDGVLMHELMAYMIGDLYECGVIGEIVSQADQESVAKNLKLGNQLRFPGIISLPLIDRLMKALRHLFDDGTLKINRNGAAAWVYENKTYVVCRTAATAIQDYLRNQQATDIPEDVTRLYDTFQEFGFADENPDGGAIWKVLIEGKDYQLTLTVLIFETKHLFKRGHHPKSMEGKIEILPQDTVLDKPKAGADLQSHESATTSHQSPANDKNPKNTATAQPLSLQSPATDTADKNIPGPLFTPPAFQIPDTGTDTTGTTVNEAGTNTAAPNTPDAGADFSKMSVPNIASPDIGQYFIDWVKASIADKSLRVNRANTPVHITTAGVALVTPSILKRFCTSMSFPDKHQDDPTWKVVQNAFHKLKLHHKSPQKTNIHTLIINGPNKSSRINAYILPIETIYEDLKPPDPNPKISLFEL